MSTKAEVKDNRIILHFESLDHALRLLQPWTGAKGRQDAAAKITQALESVGLIVELRVKGIAVAELGLNSFRGSILNVLGLAPAK